jgi:hypothetical protein
MTSSSAQHAFRVILLILVLAGPFYSACGTAAPEAQVRPVGMNLTATFNSIGIEVLFSGDENGNAAAALEFKKQTEGEWRQGLPLWRTEDGAASPGPAFYGSALLLSPATGYSLRVTVTDPDGVSGSPVLTGEITTREENIPPAGSLTPTRFVRTDGKGTADGTTERTAWRTLEQAIRDAPSGAVVSLGPGYYPRPTSARTIPITLLAQFPAVDDAQRVINEGRRSVIEYGIVSSPSGSGGPNAGVWQRVMLTGPKTGRPYPVWKWAGCGVSDVDELGYASTRADLPKRVARWALKGPDLMTPEGWAEKLYTNRTYNYGFAGFGQDLYLRLHGDLDPNACYLSASRGAGILANGPGIRLSGFEVRQVSLEYQDGATFGVVDHCLLSGAAVYFRGRQGKPSRYGADHVVQYNRILDSSLWTDDHRSNPAIPWHFIKTTLKNADGTSYPNNRIGEGSETTGIGARGGARRVVIRYNTIEGPFNGIGGYNADFDRYSMQDTDIHDNLIRRIGDDALEPEQQAINWRIWNNRIEDSAVVLSTGPVAYGPIYLFRNSAWRIGGHGTGRDNSGDPAVGSVGFKYSGSSRPAARLYVLHNTFWTDQPDVCGGDQYAGGGPDTEAFYLRNNIIHGTRYAFGAPTGTGKWDEDYNYFSSTDTGRGLRYGSRTGGRYTTDVAGYRHASGQGAHTNLAGDFITPPRLANPSTGDLTLPADSPLIDAGTPVPNLSARPGQDYSGRAPDLGAFERR